MRTLYTLKFLSFLALFVFLISTMSLSSQTTYNIDDPEDLTALSATLAAGDTVILADGIYTSEERIKFSPTTGTSTLPITFKSATPGGVKFTGGLQMNISGDYVVVDGFHWQGGFGANNFIQFRDGSTYANHSTIQNCAIDGLALSPDDIADGLENNAIAKHRWIVLYGTYNTVINCSFMNKESAGALILAEYQYNAEDDPCATVGHNISNNYFYKYEKIDNTLSNSGDSETIRIGASDEQNVNSNVTVNNNYFVESDGENEIITNKSKGNIFTNNTFRRCRGSLVLRHGSDATVDGNYFLGEDVDGTGGIRISDSDHTITNNYIQDCITVVSQAKWNNGITFIGGGDNAAVACTSGGTTNGYQKSENIMLSNNTIVNTNAPLFYNINTDNNTDIKGTVSNNLIYFAVNDPNLSDVISGDTATSYNDIGTSNELIYTGNVFTGTNLGTTNAGFSEESGIMATASDEVFTFSGTGSAGKGANMGTYEPTTDAMVGYGIGACFLDNLGAGILDGDCTIEIAESLTVSNLGILTAAAASYDVSVAANVSWTAISNHAWISVDMSSGTGNEIVSVTVTDNTDTSSRTGTVTFTQVPGGDDIERVLSVTQEGADLTDLYTLINTGTGLPTDDVQVIDFSQEEVFPAQNKFNYAKNTLDKDTNSRWAAQDGAVLAGDYKGDGEYVIYDLSETYALDLIQIATDDKSDPYGIQIWVSTTGTNLSDFIMVLPTMPDDLLITTTVGTYDDYDQYEIDVNARYVKLMSYGRFNTAGDARQSAWSNITEIEFYGESVLSVNDFDLNKQVIIYPNPVRELLNIIVQNGTIIESYKLYSIDGRLIKEGQIEALNSIFNINVSELTSGTYILNLSSEDDRNISKKILISE